MSTVQLRLQLVGDAAARLKRINNDQMSAAQRLQPLTNQQLNLNRQLANELQRQGSAFTQNQRLAQAGNAARQLGLRTERQINSEIDRVRASYADLVRLQRQGVVTANDVARAYQLANQRVMQLNRELRQTGSLQRDVSQQGAVGGNSRMGGGFLSNTATVMGGAYAGSMIVSSVLNEPRKYAESLTRSTNTLVSDEDLSQQAFNERVNETTRLTRDATLKGGASAQDMALALDKVASDGIFEYQDLKKGLLFDISQGSFASGASAFDLATMASATKNFGIDDTRFAFDVAMRQGEMGSFELKDMARYAAELLASAKNAGYSGQHGFNEIMALTQVARTATGTSGEAATNVDSLLNEFSSKHFRRLAGQYIKLEDGDPLKKIGMRGNRIGFDVTTYMTEMQKEGVGQVEAMAQLMERQFSKNGAYVEFQKQQQNMSKNYANMTSAEKAEASRTLQAQINIVAQSEIGNIFGNKQSLAAFMAYMATRGEGGRYSELLTASDSATGTIANTADRYSSTEWAKNATFDDSAFFAKLDAYTNNSGWLGDLKQKVSDWLASNESLAAHAVTAGTALLGLAATAGIASLAMGGKGSGGLLERGKGWLGKTATGAAAGAATAASAKVLIAGGLGYGLGTGVRDLYMRTESGQNFDNFVGREVAKLLAFFGNDNAKEALNNEWLAQQQKQTDVLADKLDKSNEQQKQLVTTMQETNRSIQNITDRPININGGSLLDAVGQNAQKESNRHGSIPSTPLIFKP